MNSLLAPETVLQGRYRIESLVGQGGMGAVYKAHDLVLPGRICAVKEVLPAQWHNAHADVRKSALDQFHREAITLARLDHPNLPKVSDVFTLEDREYLIMDFVSGPSLGEVLRQAQLDAPRMGLPEAQVLEWSSQLLEALDYLHGQSPAILHGDIKPGNIILGQSGLLKLVDFGLVKLMLPESQQTITVVQGRGTLAYTPLEQFGGDGGYTEPSADIYSLGATLYHLLAGKAPPDARSRFLEAGKLQTLRQQDKAISTRTETAIFHALTMHPSQRTSSAAAFRQELLEPSIQQIAESSDDSWGAALHQHRKLFFFRFAAGGGGIAGQSRLGAA